MREVYFDNSATTAVDADVAALALSAMTERFGNPSSLHRKGTQAQALLEGARAQLAGALGCEPEEVFFTSGGTEANNLAIQGAFAAHHRRAKGIVTNAAEHASVLEAVSFLAQKQGAAARGIPPAANGAADVEKIAAAADETALLVSCGLVNSETGAVSDIAALARLVKRGNSRALIHCDAVQALGKRDFSVRALGVDMLVVSGHKLHAPKGVGALYLRAGTRILPLCHGGGQEKRLRPGTENVALACAFGLAAHKAAQNMGDICACFEALYAHFIKKLSERPALCMNSAPLGAPNICNISAPGWRSETLVNALSARGVYVSNGSACHRGADSHVLTAMRLPPARVKSALRISFSRSNTVEEIDIFFAALDDVLKTTAKS